MIPSPSIYVLSKGTSQSLNLQVELFSIPSLTQMSTSALLDSGATGMFVDRKFVQQHKLETSQLPQAIPVRNMDSSINENGSITEEAHVILRLRDHTEQVCLAVTNLGQQTVIMGHSWLHHHNT